ncbi:sugar phosphate isomerase/epimerase family protein [Segetibacter koreensis]|uniref:sugar phosphate isomerase/epimerase family protein n=1 Tax=Segetibacter koreensis TaxID=398037 RepID=UPI00036A44A5|nr:sugar phosphate isomerase/epimerase [Segetibacter koreensis]
MKNSRRNFIQKAALGMAGAASTPFIGQAAVSAMETFKTEARLPVGIAGYTFAKFDVDKAIAMMNRLDVRFLSIKDMQLPLNSNDEQIKEVLSKFKEANIKIYTAGVIYMKTKQEVDVAFDYAKKVAVDMIVGVPTYDLLDYTEQKVKAMNIKIAIHNHGPEDKLYPGPQNVYEHIKNRDQRMGLCLDIGHATRAGANLEDAINDYKDRLFDLHIKDVTGAFKDAKAIEIGRGVIDFEALVKVLYKINYKGVCSIEFEKDMTDPLPGIAESIGFFRGVLAAVS